MDYFDVLLHYSSMELNLNNWDRRTEILRVSVYEHPENWIWKPAPTDYFNIWLALEARGVFEMEGKTCPFASGSAFLFPPGARPVGRAQKGTRTINFTAHIRVEGILCKKLKQLAREIGFGPVNLRNFIWASHLCRYLSEVFYLDKKANRRLVLSGLELLLHSILRDHELPASDSSNEALIEAIGRIRRNPAASYTVTEMAAASRLSTSQFNRRFQLITGLTPNRFLIEERIARAESYLRETTLTVQEIAIRLGYRDVYFFSRQFRRFRGVPPTKIR